MEILEILEKIGMFYIGETFFMSENHRTPNGFPSFFVTRGILGCFFTWNHKTFYHSSPNDVFLQFCSKFPGFWKSWKCQFFTIYSFPGFPKSWKFWAIWMNDPNWFGWHKIGHYTTVLLKQKICETTNNAPQAAFPSLPVGYSRPSCPYKVSKDLQWLRYKMTSYQLSRVRMVQT